MDKTIDFLHLYEELFKILPSGSLQKLMDVCYEITGIPILVVDIMYNVFGIAPQRKIGDYNWDYLQEHRGYETEMIVQLYEEGIMQSVNNQKAPFIVDWGSCEGAPKIQGVIKVNNIIEGYVTMNCIHHPVTPESMKAMEIIQNVCAFFFKDNDTESSMYHTYQKAFIAELFNGRIQNNRQLDLWFQDTGMKLEPPYRIVTVTTLETNEKNVLSYIRKTVFQFFPYQLALIQQNVLYILQYNLDISPRTPNAEKLFHTSLSKFNAQCGVSNPFCSLLETPYYQLQAEDAMRLGKKFGSGYRIAYYKDYYLPAILSPRIDQMPMCNYVSPIITVLQKYDALHSTDFFNTLKCYVMNLCSTADTAEELHIHRNTLLYRVKKIEEISGYSLTDPDIFMHVMISFYMLHYA